MTLKEILVSNFLKDERRNFTIFNTNAAELGTMYEKVFECIKRGEDFKKFLVFERAMTPEGTVKADRLITYFDKDLKREIKVPVVFKYSVYSYFHSEYSVAMERIKERREMEPLPEPPPALTQPHWSN